MGRIYENLELIGARVLVRPLPEVDVTAGGIIRPESTRHQQNRAIVERTGPGELLPDGVTRRAMTLTPGDLVLYQKFAGTWVILDEHERLMLMEDEVQGRVPSRFIELVQHVGATVAEHLEGEPCLICMRPAEDAAKAELEALRSTLVRESSASA